MWEPARPDCCTDFLCTLLTKVFSSSPTSHLKNCASNCISRSLFLLPPHGCFLVAILSSTPFVRFYGFTVRLPPLGRTGRSMCLYVYVFICVCLCVYPCTYMCVYMYIHMCTYVLLCGCLCAYPSVVRAHTFMHNCW